MEKLPKHRPLRIPAGWKLQHHNLWEDQPVPLDASLLWLSRDHIQVDFGWAPPHDPAGSFHVNIAEDRNWADPLAQFQSPDLDTCVDWIEGWLASNEGRFIPDPRRGEAQRMILAPAGLARLEAGEGFPLSNALAQALKAREGAYALVSQSDREYLGVFHYVPEIPLWEIRIESMLGVTSAELAEGRKQGYLYGRQFQLALEKEKNG